MRGPTAMWLAAILGLGLLVRAEARENCGPACSDCGPSACECDTCADDACGDCGSCDMGCCDSCSKWGLIAGVEATFLTPDFDNDNAGFDLPFADGTIPIGAGENFDYDFEAAPRLWVGFESCSGVGVRGRYWEFDAEADRILLADADDGDVVDVEFFSQLEAYTIDLEATKRIRGCNCEFLASFGVRHAAIAHDYSGRFLSILDDEGGLLGGVDLGRRFDGLGLTAGLEGKHRLGRNEHKALFWSLRSSVLWGDNKASAIQNTTEIDDDADTSIETTSFDEEDDDVVWINEFQLGGEYRWNYRQFGGGTVFVRAGFEGQCWALDEYEIDDVEFTADALGQGDVFFYGGFMSVGVTR